MIINEDKGFAFTHLQKCGGNTLKKYLLDIPGSRYEQPVKGFCHSCVGDMPYKHLFNFATIRDPLTWYLSMYYFSKKARNQEGDIFGDVNKISFKEWLHNATHPKLLLRKAPVATFRPGRRGEWRSEIGLTVPKEYITEGSLDVGWWSYRFLYGVCSDHKNLFRFGTDTDLIHQYHNIVNVDCLIKVETMDYNLPRVLEEHTGCVNLPPLGKVRRENTTRYDKRIEKHYDDFDVAKVIDKDFIFFENHYGVNEELPDVWYRRLTHVTDSRKY